MTTRLLITATFALLLLAAPANAALVYQTTGAAFAENSEDDGCSRYQQCGTKRTVVVVAAPGERNSVTAYLADPSTPFGNLIVRDSGDGSLKPELGSNCATTGPGEVTCAAPAIINGQAGPQVAEAFVNLGDGHDSIEAGALRIRASGGPGDDTLTATQSAVVFHGGDGRDTLHGGPGDDWLIGGTGRDALFGRAGADRLSARDKTRDRVSCGSGKSKDRVRADRKDKISGCEKRSLK